MKVKCSLCGKVGLSYDTKALNRHMRLAHGKNSAKNYFIEAAPSSIVDIKNVSKKVFDQKLRREVNSIKPKEEGGKEMIIKSNKKIKRRKSRSIYWRIVLKSGFETKK